MKYLNKLFRQLQFEIEKRLGRTIYAVPYRDGRGYKLFAREDYRGNFGYVNEKIRSDHKFPYCPLPHLIVAVKKEWADDAGVVPENINPNGWHEKGHPEAYWCIPEGDYEKLREVAKYLAKIYRASPAQQFING
jgi:hypothetical protein